MKRLALTAAIGLSALPALAETPLVTLHVTFEPATAKALADAGEMVVIAGHFFGEPVAGATVQPDEIGQILLGREEFTVRPAETTVVLGSSLGTAPLDQVVEPYLNVNVFTARFTSEDNLIDCGLVDDAVAKMTGPQEMSCKLLP